MSGRQAVAFNNAVPVRVARSGKQDVIINRRLCGLPSSSSAMRNCRTCAVISSPSDTSHDVNSNHHHTNIDRLSNLRLHSLPPPPPSPLASSSSSSSPPTTSLDRPISSPSLSSSSASSAPPAAPCTPLAGRAALNAALSAHSSDTPIIVLYHARWCRVCKTLRHKLPNVATQFPSLIWYDVDFAVIDNRSLCNDLNVRLLPTFRLYWGGATDQSHAEDFTTGPFGAKRLVERLKMFLPNQTEL